MYTDLSVRPAELPRIRRQLAATLDRPDSALRTQTSSEVQPALDRLTRVVQSAELYWVAPDMAALAVHAGGDLAAASWAVADRPTGCGLLWWGDGVHHITLSPTVRAPIDALSWGPGAEGVEVWAFIHRRRVADAAHMAGAVVDEAEVPPLVPMLSCTVPADADPLPVAELVAALAEQAPEGESMPAAALMTLAATWLLMDQPTLVERTRDYARTAEARSSARAGLPPSKVTRFDLRRQYVAQGNDPDAGNDGRTHRNRWVVSGHWRQQPHGPGRQQRRQQWIPAYVKGPDGAPLLATERVNVWRR